MPKKYKTSFVQLDGSPLPLYTHPTLVHGVLRIYYRHPAVKLARGEGTIKGAILRAGGKVELSRAWWDKYQNLRYGTRLPDADDAAVEPGGIVPGSWDALIAHFEHNSAQWRRNKASTKAGTRIYLKKIGEAFGPYKVAKTTAVAIKTLIDRKEFGDPATGTKPAPSGARLLRTTFHMLCEHARKPPLSWIATNPIADIDKPRSTNPKGHRTWLESEVNAWRLAFPDPASDARRFLEIGLAFGARAGDLMSLGWKNIEDGVLSFTPEKTERSTSAEVHLEVRGSNLLAVLAHCPKNQTYFFEQPPAGFNQWTDPAKLVALRAKPWSYTRLRKSFAGWRSDAGLADHCVIHGLRKLFATRMANAGASVQDIADALGDTVESAQIYIQARDRRKGAARGQRLVHEAA